MRSATWAELLELTGWFHDAWMTEIRVVTGTVVDSTRGMHQDGRPTARVLLLLQNGPYGAAILDFADARKLEFDVETEYLEAEDSLDQNVSRFDVASISVWSGSVTGVLFDRSVLESPPTLDNLEDERLRVTFPDT